MQNINGGEIDLDVNKLVDQLNPMQWMYDFGHDVGKEAKSAKVRENTAYLGLGNN